MKYGFGNVLPGASFTAKNNTEKKAYKGDGKKDGYLLYITCSVLRQENEEITAAIQQKGLTLIEQKVITGYNKKADTMFAALFKK